MTGSGAKAKTTAEGDVNINIHPTGVFGIMFMIFFAIVIVIGTNLTHGVGNFVLPLKEKKKEKKMKTI